jgi:hypothetical protein
MADKKCFVRHQLYFSQQSSLWRGGVAFIKSTPSFDSTKDVSFGRRYLITKEQFVQVVRQECNLKATDSSLEMDFESASKSSQYMIGPDSKCRWYGRIINLGSSFGITMFTFTAKWEDDAAEYSSPSEDYLRLIIEGLKETHNLSDREIAKYLVSTPGINGRKTLEELETLAMGVIAPTFTNKPPQLV